MLFSSIPFLYYFLPAVILAYFVFPAKLKNAVLLFSSLFFYSWGEPKYLFLIIVSITTNYIAGLLVEKSKTKKLKRLFLVLSLIISLGLLGYFKYADFFISSFNSVTGLQLPLLKIALPIGISFYTFQTISYTIDVYRGDTKAQKNLISFASYVSMFPQLIAGPIVRYSDIAIQLEERSLSFNKFAEGARRFIFGLSKKILIANSLGELCDIFKSSNEKAVLFYWLYAVAFSLHIYFDFSGYSDMAIGLGKIFGFDFLENFNYPYISKSITEFWRRWHMSLGGWFRDYVYIPLGGNRVSKLRNFFNILVVWMLTGLWHGAAWNFVLWGLLFAFLLIIEKTFLLNFLKNSKVISRIYTLVIVVISFVIFNATDVGEAFEYIGAMFGAGKIPMVSSQLFYYFKSYFVTLVIALFGSTPLLKNGIRKLKENEKTAKLLNIIEIPVLIALLIVITAYLVDGSFNPFLYFRF